MFSFILGDILMFKSQTCIQPSDRIQHKGSKTKGARMFISVVTVRTEYLFPNMRYHLQIPRSGYKQHSEGNGNRRNEKNKQNV
jgi:hypothetical protein